MITQHKRGSGGKEYVLVFGQVKHCFEAWQHKGKLEMANVRSAFYFLVRSSTALKDVNTKPLWNWQM